MPRNTPRGQRQIQRVIDTIWVEGQRVKCPVCASPMKETEPYVWVCSVDRCPIDKTEFNEVIHNYGIRSKPKR